MEELLQVNWGIIAPLIALQLILMITALVSCFRHSETNGPKWLWLLMIIFVGTIGPILYFVVGRKNE
ncbi:PLD nuclease N-terminal domain-containing protein [Alkalihalobacillus sp. R86527]|uniref:PLD nuclease N-terminal domain-containing protein n=1 Tax=Alkalihalobacillus sp. R86527 TaxID=3093863 RepID=UPI00366D361E